MTSWSRPKSLVDVGVAGAAHQSPRNGRSQDGRGTRSRPQSIGPSTPPPAPPTPRVTARGTRACEWAVRSRSSFRARASLASSFLSHSPSPRSPCGRRARAAASRRSGPTSLPLTRPSRNSTPGRLPTLARRRYGRRRRRRRRWARGPFSRAGRGGSRGGDAGDGQRVGERSDRPARGRSVRPGRRSSRRRISFGVSQGCPRSVDKSSKSIPGVEKGSLPSVTTSLWLLCYSFNQPY